MKLLIELDEEYVKAIDKIRFLVGGRTDRKLQLEIIKAIKNGKALEQEPILDKIRAEILEEMLSHSGTGEEVIQAYADGLKKGLEFIDKYKAEVEPQESNEKRINTILNAQEVGYTNIRMSKSL